MSNLRLEGITKNEEMKLEINLNYNEIKYKRKKIRQKEKTEFKITNIRKLRLE
jgi:hypothetical protein